MILISDNFFVELENLDEWIFDIEKELAELENDDDDEQMDINQAINKRSSEQIGSLSPVISPKRIKESIINGKLIFFSDFSVN